MNAKKNAISRERERERVNNRFLIFAFSFVFLIFNSSIILPSSYASVFTLPNILPGESQEIQVLGSTVNIKGLTDQDNLLSVNGRAVAIQKDGSFKDDVIIPLGDTEIQVAVTDKSGKVKIYTKKITAKENHFFMVGLADGTLNFSRAPEGVEWERDSKHYKSYKSGFTADGKISYYLAGKMLGKFLIKSALDTDKATQEKLFTYIDPDKYYPIYGDDSTVVYDVNSQGKFYLLVEWDKSGVTVGNFQTQINDDGAKLATYNRTLYGGKAHLESTQTTIYGEPITKADLFAAEANQHAGHNEFLATGGSLYYLRHTNIVEGSEQVRLEVRDKNTAMALYSIPKAPFTDYEIKYDEGRVMFKEGILSVASSDTLVSSSVLSGNPVYVVVNYEYKQQDAFPVSIEEFGQRTGGFRVSQALGNNVRLGMTYVQEQQDDALSNYKQYKVYGVDGETKIGNFTKAAFEYAETASATVPIYMSYNGGYDFTTVNVTQGVKDKALRVSFNTNLGEYLGKGREFLDISGYYQYIGNNFVTSDNLFQAGTEKYGFEAAHRFTKDDKARLIYEKKALETANQVAKNDITAGSVQDFIAQWTHTSGKWTFITENAFKDKTDSYSYRDQGQRHPREDSIAERIRYDISKDTSVFVGEQITIRDSLNNRSSAGFSTSVSKDLKVTAEGSLGSDGSSVVASLNRAIDKDTTAYTNYTFVDSAIDGKSSATSFGSNTAMGPNAKLNTERQFISSDTRGVYATNLTGIDYKVNPRCDIKASYQRRDDEVDYNLINAIPRDTVTANLSYIMPDFLKAYSKGEYRNDSNKTWQAITDNSAELKIFNDIFLFGEYEYSIAYGEMQTDSLSRIDKKQIGLAYRPVRFDWFNLLFKYIRFTDERPDGVLNADGGFFKMHSTSDTLAGECALDLPFNLQFVEKFAYKYEKSLSYDTLGLVKTPDGLKAILMIHRLNYHVTKKWDAALEYRVLQQKSQTIQPREDGFLIEANYLIMKNIAIGAGWNFTHFNDTLNMKLSDMRPNSARGFFLRLQGRY